MFLQFLFSKWIANVSAILSISDFSTKRPTKYTRSDIKRNNVNQMIFFNCISLQFSEILSKSNGFLEHINTPDKQTGQILITVIFKAGRNHKSMNSKELINSRPVCEQCWQRRALNQSFEVSMWIISPQTIQPYLHKVSPASFSSIDVIEHDIN